VVAEQQPGALTCVLAGGDDAVRKAISAYLEAHDIAVVGDAADADDFLALLAAEQPEAAVVDAGLVADAGVELIRRAGLASPETRVVVYARNATPQVARCALREGARGLIEVEFALEQLLHAIGTATSGGAYLDPRVVGAVTASGHEQPGSPMSARELEILRRLADGHSNAEIGAQLYLAPDTVRTYLRRAMQKLGARTRTEAVASALRKRLID
jgi:DNA-binding NarL/FixJ family response regulator